MNKEQLEKIFDEKYLKLYGNNDEYGCMAIKQFIFENIVPEVIREILPCDKDIFEYVKNESKQKFLINL